MAILSPDKTVTTTSGQGTILQYLPSQLVGIYFEEVTS